jgi:hypothetical protein
MFETGLNDPFGHFKHKLWPKEGSGVKLGIGVSHTVGKLSMRATTLLDTSSQSEVFTQSYGPPKLWESQLWEFRDSHLGVPGQNDIWVLVSWPSIEYTEAAVALLVQKRVRSCTWQLPLLH